MDAPDITAYINPYCPWTPGVVAVLNKYGLSYNARDVTRDATAHEEMVRKSRQYSSPGVEINGHMLADVGGDEVEAWLKEQGFAPV